MGWRQSIRAALRRIHLGGRRVAAHAGRAHVELRDVDNETLERHAPKLREALERLPGVEWARINLYFRRAVIAFEREIYTEELLAQRVAEVEQQVALTERGFALEPQPHPGDPEPRQRALVEIAANGFGMATGLGLRSLRVKPVAIEVDFAALLSLMEEVPGIRRALEARMGKAVTEMSFVFANAFNRALLQSIGGPVVDIAQRALRLREADAAQRVWLQHEPTLAAYPEAHEQPLPDIPPRPCPLPHGPIERYAEKALTATLGGFGLGLASTQSMELAAASIFGGVPKPARAAREAYASHLGWRWANAGLLILDSEALRRLDRIDTVVLPAAMLQPDAAGADGDDPASGQAPGVPREAKALVQAIRAAELELHVWGDAQAGAEWARPERWIDTTTDVAIDIRHLQAAGRGVCYFGWDAGGLAAADFGVGLVHREAPAPWAADVVCPAAFSDFASLVQCIDRGRKLAHRSVHFALLEVVCGAVVSAGGLRADTTRQVMSVAHSISLLALANGVRTAQQVPVGRKYRVTAPPWHAMDTRAVLAGLDSSELGLSELAAAGRRVSVDAEQSQGRALLGLFLSELDTPFVPVLAVGAGLSAWMGSVVDAALIAAVVGVNGVIGAAQRARVERALASLEQIERRQVRVMRPPGETVWVAVDALVVGDVIELSAGDVVPADCRILQADGLEVDESSLTGESLPISKSPEPSPAAAVADRTCMLYEGTAVAGGRVVAVVVAVGADTEARSAMQMVARTAAMRGGVETRLNELTKVTAPLAVASGAAVVGAGVLRRRSTREMIGAAVSLAVAAVPEGLPMLATMAQLAAAGRMRAKGVLVRNPRTIEALGRMNVLCADKTGTLTQGRIRLSQVVCADGSQGAPGPDGRVGGIVAAALRATPEDSGRQAHLTDQALVDGARAAGVGVSEGAPGWQRISELPFEPGRGFHAVLGRSEGDGLLSVKGAPEVVVPRCTHVRSADGSTEALDADGQNRLIEMAIAQARQGFRVLAVAQRPVGEQAELGADDVDALVFEGLVGLSDPVRETAKEGVAALRQAGVQVVMVTGDHPSTAEAIAAELGQSEGRIVSGGELEQLEDAELDAILEDIAVFARVTPRQKVRIVQAYQRAGKVVGMTGDGANDAPAIRLAAVGIALGEESTSSARDAADIVVSSGQLETITEAVVEGRALWGAVRDAVAILVGGNIGEISFTVLGSLVSGQTPLNARQLLLVNLLTDALPALTVAVRPPAGQRPEQLLKEGPEASLGKSLTRELLTRATITGGVATGAWGVARLGGTQRGAQTVGLMALIGTQLGQTLLAGGRDRTIAASAVGSGIGMFLAVQTPGVSQFFGCRPLGPIGMAQAATAIGIGTGASAVLPLLIERWGDKLDGNGALRHSLNAWSRRARELDWMPDLWSG